MRTTITLITIACLLVVAGPVRSAEQGVYDPSFLGSTLWSEVHDIIIDDTLAYLGMESGVMVLDISDPTAPSFVSKLYLDGGYVAKMQKRNDTLWLSEWWVEEIRVLDVSDPLHMRLIAHYKAPAIVRGFELVDTLLYISYGSGTPSGIQGLQIVNSKIAASMAEISRYPLELQNMFGVRVHGKYVYLLGGGNVYTFDATDVTSPQLLSTFATGYSPWEAAFGASDTLLYVADNSPMAPAWQSALTILNVADPSSPAIVDQRVVDDAAWHLAVRGDIVYLCNGVNGLLVFDVGDPTAIDSIGFYWLPGFAGALAVQDSLMMLMDRGEYDWEPGPEGGPQIRDLSLLNVADPVTPTLMGFYSFPGEVLDVAVLGSYAYVMAPSPSGPDIYVVDFSDPTDPQVVDSYDPGGEAQDIALTNRLLYVAAASGGLEILSLTEPAHPVPVTVIDYPATSANVVAAHDTSVFVGLGPYGQGAYDLSVVNVADPDNPIELVRRILSFRAWDFVFGYSNLYMAMDDHEGYVYGIEDLTNPHVVGKFGPPCALLGEGDNPCSAFITLCISGDRLFANNALMGAGFDLFEIGPNPQSPEWIGFSSGAPRTYGTVGTERYAYLSDGTVGIHVVDIQNPQPYPPFVGLPRVGFYDTPGWPENQLIVDDLLLVCDDYGFDILQLPVATGIDDDPGDPVLPRTAFLKQNYPNPFNPETMIEYELPTRTHVTLSIYNLLGQQVTTLLDTEQGAGRHRVSWPGTNGVGDPVASGVYFYRLQVNESTETKKMLLIR